MPGSRPTDRTSRPFRTWRSRATTLRLAQGDLATVNAIWAIGGKADNIELDQAGWWQGNYAGPFGNDYVGRRLAHDDD